MREPLVLALLAVSSTVSSAWLLWDDGLGGPAPRAGHSLIVYNNTVVIFGGRSNEQQKIHDPRTYQIAKENGRLYFQTFEGKHVKECLDENGVQITAASNSTSYAECYNINVGTYWNDIWSYWLGCPRDGDNGCVQAPEYGWKQLSQYARLGGCTIIQEKGVCTHPHERWEHSAAILSIPPNMSQGAGYGLTTSPPSTEAGGPTNVDGLLVIYGGYAQLCEDYCSDMWAFPVSACQKNATACSWSRMATLGRSGPGERWRAASASDGLRWVVFGGHRLWHGFAPENEEANRWSSTSKYPYGGYMDDLWLFGLHPRGLGATLYNRTTTGLGTTLRFGGAPSSFTIRELILDEPVHTDVITVGNTSVQGAWQQVIPRESCFKSAGESWEARRDIICTILWPQKRANSAIVLAGELLYLYGGYTTEFPYPHVRGRGSAAGIGSMASDSKSPYPTGPYYLGDMWLFDWRTGMWEEVKPVGSVRPVERSRHSLILASNVLLMFGGYSNNNFMRDLWFYNLTNNRWLEKTYFPVPLFPDSCSSDVRFDPAAGEEVPIFDPMPGGGRQRRMSVFGEPTRGTLIDGRFGRANYDVFVRQTRRQAPGWDGCRDRADGRLDLPGELLYVRPMQRAGHAAAFSPVTGEMLVFGGETLEAEQAPGIEITWNTVVTGDMWAWRRDRCPQDCSGQGDCWYGHCYCYDGYYGIDCSNSTCPGSYCVYDTDTHTQQCQHCCSAPYNHSDADVYVQNQRKVQCSATDAGLSHGICDGFGFCQCAPPFLGEDCSMKDCPNNCTGNGWCSVDYPVSRCMCEPPWTGGDCSIPACLNNCSWPNGECMAGGVCNCSTLVSPYNKSVTWVPYAGDDCSYVQPFAGAAGVSVGMAAGAWALTMALCLGCGGAGCTALGRQDDEETAG